MNCIEAVILFLQLILIGGQLCLSNKINNQSLSKSKGYFVLEKKHHYYDLRNKLSFIAVGENDIIVTGNTIEVDGVIKDPNSAPKDTFFTRNCEYGICEIEVPISEAELSRDRIILKVKFFLKNPQDYRYQEELIMEFSKRKEPPLLWEVVRFNLSFDK